MEGDNHVWVNKVAESMNEYLESSIQKMDILLKDLWREPNSTSFDCGDLMDVHDVCYEFACKVSGWYEKKYPAVVPWLPEDETHLKRMTLMRSSSPWSTVLTYSPPDVDLLKNYTEESLRKFIETPQIGSFVCVCYRKKLFRGHLLGMLSYNRLKVLNIDTNDVFIVPTSSIFHMPPDICETHALAVRCSLIEDDEIVQKLWSDDLQAIFTRALEDCSLEVKVLKTISESPPKYLIDVIGTNCDGYAVSLTDWLYNTLIPDMKMNFHLLTSKEELLYFLKDESIEPFRTAQANPCDTSLSFSMSKEQLLSSLCAVPPPSLGAASSSTVLNDEDDKQKLLTLSSNKSSRKLSCENTIAKNRDLNVRDVKNASEIRGGQQLFFQVKNKITLPAVGERVNVEVTHVFPSLSFYVVLDEKYSNIVDNKGIENYKTLISRMNQPSNLKKCSPLSAPPRLGQLVTFRGKYSSDYMRGVVTDISQDSVTVLNPDLGQSEILHVKDLWTIAEENTILPFQAVLTFLHNICFADDPGNRARDYFLQLTASKKLHVLVKSVNVANCVLEVELFTSDEVNINEALISSGLCVRVRPVRVSSPNY